MGEFLDVIWVVLFFNQDDQILHGCKGASEDTDCIHFGVCQVAGVKVAGCHIGLELLTPTFIGDRCDAGIKEPTPQFGVRHVAEHLPNFSSIVSVTYSDSWVEISFQITLCLSLGLRARSACTPPGLFLKESLASVLYRATATLLHSVFTCAFSSAKQQATVCDRGFLRSALSASMKWGGAMGRLRRMEN